MWQYENNPANAFRAIVREINFLYRLPSIKVNKGLKIKDKKLGHNLQNAHLHPTPPEGCVCAV